MDDGGGLSQRPTDRQIEALVYLYSRLPFLIQRASQILTALFVAQPDDHAITLPQFHILEALAREGGCPQIDLARRAGVDAATTGLILGNLVRSGKATRHVAPTDARRKLVTITEEGREALAAAAKRSRAVDELAAAKLGEDAWTLARLLDKYGLHAPIGGGETNDRRLDLALRLRRCLQISERILADLVGPLDLTMRQFAVLYLMYATPGLTRADVVRLLGYERSNAVLVVRILRTKALIEPVDLRREGRLRLTPAGEEMLRESFWRAFGAEPQLGGGLDDAETVTLQRLLGRTLCAFDADARQPMSRFVEISSRAEWPVPTAPAPSFVSRPHAVPPPRSEPKKS